MENFNPDQEKAKLENFFDSKLDLKRSDIRHIVQVHLEEKSERGCCLNIVTCGPCKSGKSTLLNSLVAEVDDTNKINLEIFPTGFSKETSLPWLFKESKQLASDMIEVSHVDLEGKESPKKTFTKFEEYQKYVKENYTSKALEKQMGAGNIKPYFRINVNYGTLKGTKKLWKEVEEGINILDLQGFNQIGADTTLRGIGRPFVLCCCFQTPTSFFKTTEYIQLKKIIRESNPYRVCFIATETQTSINNFMKEEKVTEARAFEKLKDEVLTNIKPNDFDTKFDVFFFDPKDRSAEACQEIRKIRKLLSELKKQSTYHETFNASLTMIEDVLNQKENKSRQHQECQESQLEIDSLFKCIQEKLAYNLTRELSTDLPNRIKRLAQERKAYFINEENKTGSSMDLEKKLNEWLLNDGYRTAVLELSKEKIQEFQRKVKSKGDEGWQWDFKTPELPTNFDLKVIDLNSLEKALQKSCKFCKCDLCVPL